MSVPIYLRGRNLTSVILTPQTIGTAGALSDGTPVTITTTVDGLQFQLNAQNENISAVNSAKANYVNTEDEFTATLRVIKVNDTTDPDKLQAAIITHDLFKLAWTEGTGGSAKTVTVYGTRGPLDTGIEGKGKQTSTLTFQSVDAGTAWYARS